MGYLVVMLPLAFVFTPDLAATPAFRVLLGAMAADLLLCLGMTSIAHKNSRGVPTGIVATDFHGYATITFF